MYVEQDFVSFLSPSFPAFLSLFPLTCLSVPINYSSTSWHERRNHTDDEDDGGGGVVGDMEEGTEREAGAQGWGGVGKRWDVVSLSRGKANGSVIVRGAQLSMCLLCCGHTLAAYAEDNVIVGMNEADPDGSAQSTYREPTVGRWLRV